MNVVYKCPFDNNFSHVPVCEACSASSLVKRLSTLVINSHMSRIEPYTTKIDQSEKEAPNQKVVASQPPIDIATDVSTSSLLAGERTKLL